jgi:uncharacterized protein YejL (UPF0352 family)
VGFFDFFKTTKANEAAATVSRPSLPTVTPDKEIYSCYDEIFSKEMTTVTGVTNQEKTEILKMVKAGEGGFLDMSGYHEPVWNTYFKGKSWAWGEFEEWNSTFEQLGKFPSRFPRRKKYSPDDLDEVLNKFKVAELKALCDEHKIPTVGKTKKQDLIQLVKTIPNLFDLSLIQEQIQAIQEKFAFEIYVLLMRTISFRAKSLYDQRRAERLGVKKFEISHAFESDKEFVELALRKNPNALHPLYPSDLSSKKPIITI